MCVSPECDDTFQNGQETDVDCGGPSCAPCDDNASCEEPDDCSSGVCTGDICQTPTCDDGVQNQGESDIDCGIPDCGRCDEDQQCENNNQCSSGVCTGDICQAPSCNDSTLNQDETDTDCGGLTCGGCELTEACEIDDDCTDGTCISLTCQLSSPYAQVARDLGAILIFAQNFDEQILDESGNNHHGTLHGGANWTDSNGPTDALPGYLHNTRDTQSYTAVDDHPDLNLTGTHTITYWRFRHAEPQTNWEAEFAKGNDTYQLRTLQQEEDRLRYSLRDNPDDDLDTSEDGLSLDDWHFVVVVFDQQADEMLVFIDDMDTPDSEGSRTEDLSTNDHPLTIGAWISNGGDVERYSNVHFSGFTIFDHALSSTERQDLMDAD